MKTLDLLRFCTVALLRQRLRTLLSLLGVAVGVAAVVVLTTLGDGARKYIEQQFEFLGSNVMVVLPGKVDTRGAIPGLGGTPNDLTLQDLRALQRQIPELVTACPISMGSETVSCHERSRQVLVMGTTIDLQKIQELALQAGTFLPPGDVERGSSVVVLGSALARELFGFSNAVGKVVRVGDWRLRVIGVLRERGIHLGLDIDEMAYVPVASALRMFNESSLFRILLQMNSQADHDAVRARVIATVTDRHGEEDVTCVTPDAILSTVGELLDKLTLALVGIAAISLSVAGIGIMNVMLVSVAERTAEIGLLKALGARQRQILSLFLAESASLSLLGGLIGCAVGLLLIRLIVLLLPTFPASPPLWALLSAMTVALLVGVLFGSLPAHRATRLDPVESLNRGSS